MNSQPGSKRFIAGAVCPRCGVQDRIRVYSIDGATYRECVACDFSDLLEEAAAAAPPEGGLPGGRLDGPRKSAPAQGQPLQFHPPKARRKKTGDEDVGAT